MEDFNHAHINWLGVNVGDTETKFLDNINICFLEKLLRDQKKKSNLTSYRIVPVTLFRILLSKA